MRLAFILNFANLTCQKTLLKSFSLVIAAATEDYDNSKDDNPSAVIVEKMAKAVVIHSMFLRCMFAIFGSLIYILCATTGKRYAYS